MKRKQLLALVLVISVMIGMMPVAKARQNWEWTCHACWSTDIKEEVIASKITDYDKYEHHLIKTYFVTCNQCGNTDCHDIPLSESHAFTNGDITMI